MQLQSPLSVGITSPDKIASHNSHSRYALKDSLYLDLGKSELNGKIDTLTSGSMTGSLLLINKNDSNNASTPGSVSTFAKSKGLSEIMNKGQNRSFKNSSALGLGNHQSILKAAIIRNMQNNIEKPVDENDNGSRRGSVGENALRVQVDRRVSYFSNEQSEQKDDQNEKENSWSPDHKRNLNNDKNFKVSPQSNGHSTESNSDKSSPPMKRYQLFG